VRGWLSSCAPTATFEWRQRATGLRVRRVAALLRVEAQWRG
jgi:hypothetical protein